MKPTEKWDNDWSLGNNDEEMPDWGEKWPPETDTGWFLKVLFGLSLLIVLFLIYGIIEYQWLKHIFSTP